MTEEQTEQNNNGLEGWRALLPVFLSHKIVHAAKILGVADFADGTGTLTLEAVAGDESRDFTVEVDGDYMKKHVPAEGGYFVVYNMAEDREYWSFSPSDVFDEGYRELSPSEQMTLVQLSEEEDEVPAPDAPDLGDDIPGPDTAEYGGIDIMAVAMHTHEVLRVIAATAGVQPRVPWDELSQGQQDVFMDGVVWMFNHPEASLEEQHNEWVRTMEDDGWSYGPEIDDRLKHHPSITPYSALPEVQKAKGELFRVIVQSACKHFATPIV